MKMISVAWRVAVVVSVALPCFGQSRLSPVRLVEGKQTLLGGETSQGGQADSAKPCQAGASLKLEGSTTSFQFSCPSGARLDPAEAVDAKVAQSEPLSNVYQFTPTSGRETAECKDRKTTLETLVPGSTLVKVSPSKPGQSQQNEQPQSEAAGPVFNLTIGKAPEQERHFCYVCTSSVAAVNREQQGGNCTVYVTVPKSSDAPPEEQSGSGSFSPSTFGWLSLSVTGCALGLVFHP